MLVAFILLAFKKPWYGVIGLTVFDYLNPHRYCWGFMYSLPAYQMLLAVVFARYVFSDRREKQPIPSDWRIPTFYFLWVWFGFTTIFAMMPGPALDKLIEVSKVYVPLILTLTLITDRQKLFALLCAMAGGIGLIAFKSGIWAIGSGFSNRVWGPPGTQYGGNNEFAIINLMMIPLLMMIARQLKSPRWQLAIRAAIPICFAAAICSWSRGALLGSGVLVLGILWHSKRKWLVAPLMVIGLAVLVTQLPDEWFGRMNTIETYEEDRSAMSRIEAWTDGWNFVLTRPLLGAGFEGWMYVTQIDWHNSAVEMLCEHGFIALFVWLLLIGGTFSSLTSLMKMGKTHPSLNWVADYALAMRLSLMVYMVGTLTLGLSYWTVLYQLVFCAVLLKKFALQELAALPAPTPSERAPLQQPGLPAAARQ
jgi:putative inorganic carbon (HCO3(-)) transporter